MIQGNYRQHWVRKEFTDIKTTVDEYFADPNETRSIVKTYNDVFGTKLDINFMENDPIIMKSYFATHRVTSIKHQHRTSWFLFQQTRVKSIKTAQMNLK